jgi:magnesium-transporting ATPase (P-type)
MPDEQIYKFEGTYWHQNFKASLGLDNFLHRGSSLRNTEWIIGATVYAGHDTKVLKNSLKTHSKQSKVEKYTNRLIVIIFVI